MATVTLKYGRDGLSVDFPETPGFVGVLEPRHQPALTNPDLTVRETLADPIASAPLAEVARGRTNAAIVVSDNTRPVPNTLLLPPILNTLEAAGIPREKITILIAT
ncbi:MAG TPA: lactate racemase domain-containing protein, partial [Alkalispirochaeta sp.]|nr:lactate racemase domain-containing protein [Alkalispirochaeta sp.]